MLELHITENEDSVIIPKAEYEQLLLILKKNHDVEIFINNEVLPSEEYDQADIEELQELECDEIISVEAHNDKSIKKSQ